MPERWCDADNGWHAWPVYSGQHDVHVATMLEIRQVLQRFLGIVDMRAAIVVIVMMMKDVIGMLSDMLDDEFHSFGVAAA